MEQYEKSGPRIDAKDKPDLGTSQSIQDLKNHIDRQDLRISELERDLRKLRNDMRTAIATFNAINSNRRRNG